MTATGPGACPRCGAPIRVGEVFGTDQYEVNPFSDPWLICDECGLCRSIPLLDQDAARRAQATTTPPRRGRED